MQMSNSNSNKDSDSTGIFCVKDSPSKNTRSASSAGQKKNVPLLKAVPKGKTKTKSKLPIAAKKKILPKNRTLPTSKAAGSVIGKASNFSAEEDNMLAKAFVNISTNPIHGSGMKSNDFWENLRQKWKELMEGTGTFTMCTSMVLKLQFQHQIQKDMNQWNACFKRVRTENQSGLNNIASITKKAEALFKATTKKPFRFAGCMEFLQQTPKFQLLGKPDIDDGSEYTPTKSTMNPQTMTLMRILMMVAMTKRNQHRNHHQNLHPRLLLITCKPNMYYAGGCSLRTMWLNSVTSKVNPIHSLMPFPTFPLMRGRTLQIATITQALSMMPQAKHKNSSHLLC
jgi:hypothetical protein